MIFMFCWHVYFIWFTLSRFHIYTIFCINKQQKIVLIPYFVYLMLHRIICKKLCLRFISKYFTTVHKKNYFKFCKKRTFYARFYDFVYRTNNKFTYMVHKNNAFLREWLLKKNHDLLFLWALNNIKNIYIKIKLKEKHEKPIRVLKLNTTKKIRKF